MIEVGAAAIVRQGDDGWQVLAARRTARRGEVADGVVGFWEFPGGKREPDETAEACIVREIGEELGVRVALHSRVDGPAVIHTGTREIAFDLRWATITCGTRPRPLDGHDEIRWLRPQEFDDVPWIPSDAAHVAEVRRTLLDPEAMGRALEQTRA